MTGRTIIWEGTLEHAALNPWTGYGMASFGSPAFDSLWVHYRPLTAHNSYLQAYFETGYVGLALMVGLIAALIVRGVYTSLLWRRLSYTLFVALYGAFSSVINHFDISAETLDARPHPAHPAGGRHGSAIHGAACRGTRRPVSRRRWPRPGSDTIEPFAHTQAACGRPVPQPKELNADDFQGSVYRAVCGTAACDRPATSIEKRLIHRFFDTPPISPSGKYIALTEFQNDRKLPVAGEQAFVIVIDLENSRKSTDQLLPPGIRS